MADEFSRPAGLSCSEGYTPTSMRERSAILFLSAVYFIRHTEDNDAFLLLH
jgi:hypothetical protein